jgi:CRISPR-associated endoribonuclease Cas6
VVASVFREDRSTRYLTPSDPDEFSEAVRRNLLRKYEALYGGAPQDDSLRLEWDSEYVRRERHGGTKLVGIKGIKVRGVLAPFTLAGSTELMALGYDAGIGEKNSMGFGMVEAAHG